MLNNKTIAVVVPAYNEESQISEVIETMPKFVDRIIIINDSSTDKTQGIIKDLITKDKNNYFNEKIGEKRIIANKYNEAEVWLNQQNRDEIKHFVPSVVYNSKPKNDRIILIDNLKNGGVGAGIARGYKWCKDNEIDCIAVMAGDGQMDPSELEKICLPVINDNVDYVKGNRLIHRSARYIIPKKRYVGNSILSIMTKIASGYWRISDTQTGYTAISLDALKAIDIHKIYRKYGMPNDLLVKLNIASCCIREVPIKPIYRVGEQSKMKIRKVIPGIAWLLFRSFFHRLWRKYFLRNFHPLFILYHIAFILLFVSAPYLIKILKLTFTGTPVNPVTVLAFIFSFLFGFQSLLFAMWMDIQDNERLYV